MLMRFQKSARRLSSSSGITFDLTPSRSDRGEVSGVVRLGEKRLETYVAQSSDSKFRKSAQTTPDMKGFRHTVCASLVMRPYI